MLPKALSSLLADVTTLPAVKIRASKELAKLDIATVRDLVLHVPNTVRGLQHALPQKPSKRLTYPSTKRLSSKKLREIMAPVFETLPELSEWIDSNFFAVHKWPHWKAAITKIHQPYDQETESAYQRLAYDELLANQLALLISRRRFQSHEHYVLGEGDTLRKKYLKTLPFELTESQSQVCREIAMDLASGQRMLRLLQGDVGSGKTAVALYAILMAVESGKQAAFMAPTEIVARQHYEWIEGVLGKMKLSAVLLTGSDHGPERAQKLARIHNGDATIVIGTHALFQDEVEFANLALIVVDEQHRFGVNQRLQLASKGQDDQGARPHMLLMTATPIPRTMTLTAFGDMDVSRLTDKPPGRKPIITKLLPQSQAEKTVASLTKLVAEGKRIYWICPTIEGSEESSLMSAEKRYTMFGEIFPGEVGLVHGRIDTEARQKILADFLEGGIKLLISTTVIEVGVDVPDATVIVIEHAERFGLAQLHQLRGRVGRGQQQSFCYLIHADQMSEHGSQRLKRIASTEDGFEIAEEDWKIRGVGDLMGTKQSGAPRMVFADLQTHHELGLAARDNAKVLLAKDPNLISEQGEVIRTLLYLFGYADKVALLDDGMRSGAAAA